MINSSSGLKWYSDLRGELGKYGIPIDDIPKFAKLVNNIRQHDYDPKKVIDKFSDLESLRPQENLPSLEKRWQQIRTTTKP
ncbi:MAG: hypothetical protein WAM14_08390 [Candidatus Nitrosopolaris sp.]